MYFPIISFNTCAPAERNYFLLHAMALLFISALVFNSTNAIAQNASSVKIGSGTLDSDRAAGPRWMRVNFDSLASDIHTISVAWDNNSDIGFVIRHQDGTLVNPTVSGSNPAIWTGPLDAGERYYLGVRANSGAANFTATIKLGEEPEQPADPNDEDGALAVSYTQRTLPTKA